ncbi:hypothetical protein ymoll0001_40010 [Yersinia mollaretii ATCC 43969]|uniref:Uncharacterized protein n=1 Tax=Yersinia mollaretii (strain ATCC 43969 / DSM 18520 / CIP 103324 / CNY 7263 / WAIP 204) TaxID=349967 RepID=A0ABP2E834_YERMW|nr:hypothetical protein ymoll0001_40010 [Yersinia mollaretii ATCC 43969]
MIAWPDNNLVGSHRALFLRCSLLKIFFALSTAALPWRQHDDRPINGVMA